MLPIQLNNEKPYYEQVVAAIKEQCLYGILAPGDKIPSVREMAKHLMINPNTISKAYKELEHQQVIETVRGKGTFIKTNPQEKFIDPHQIEELKQKFEALTLEAIYLEIDKTQLQKWIENIYNSIPGRETDES